MYILYGGGYSRANLTEMVMTEVGTPYRVEHIDILKGEHKSPEFLEKNPAGWVPALETPDGTVLYETPAINLYLADRYGNGTLAPAVNEPERGLFLSGLFYLTDELEPALKRYFYPHRYTVRESDEAVVRQVSLESVQTCLQVIDTRLQAHGPFHLGARYSLVDLTLAYWVTSLLEEDTAQAFDATLHCTRKVAARASTHDLFATHLQRSTGYATVDASGARAR